MHRLILSCITIDTTSPGKIFSKHVRGSTRDIKEHALNLDCDFFRNTDSVTLPPMQDCPFSLQTL
mgnify:CR=1 FL=1